MKPTLLDRDPVTPDPAVVLVAGASGGIGAAYCREVARALPEATLIRLARETAELPRLDVRTVDLDFDIADEKRVADAVAAIPSGLSINSVFIATGWLHDSEHQPEKTYRQLSADHLLHAYQVNAVGPALLAKHLVPRLDPDAPAAIGILSARVGSISDNRLGGWHAYRASKAALNMLIRNLAIEFGRKRPGHVIVGLQPGTTDTALSAPFQRNIPADQLQSPEYTAAQLFKVMQRLNGDDSGRLFDFLGLEFEP